MLGQPSLFIQTPTNTPLTKLCARHCNVLIHILMKDYELFLKVYAVSLFPIEFNNGYRISGFIDRGKFVVNLGC